MIPHLICAEMAQQIYAGPSSFWDHYFDHDQIVIGVKQLGSVSLVVFRGSATPLDWLRDLKAMPIKHPKLGYVHKGFFECMDDDIIQELSPTLGPNIVITGHSLGAAHAWAASALLHLAGFKIAQVTVFGSPRPGFKQLRDIITATGAQNTSYRNLLDPVTYVPDLFNLYVAPVPYSVVREEPRIGAPATDHLIEYYVTALRRISGGVSALLPSVVTVS